MNIPNDPKGAAGALKTPLGLIPSYAMEQTAWVHKLGADKYGRKVPIYACNDGIELAEFCSCGFSTQNQRAIQKDHTPHADYVFSAIAKNTQEVNKPLATKEELRGLKDYVNPATTNTSDFQIQITIDDKKLLLTTGSQKIKSILESNRLNTIADLKLRKETLSAIGLELFNHLGYRWKMNSEFWASKITDVKFAVDQQEEKDYLTSTMTTSLENLEDLYATGVIKGLACSETILSLLKKHSHTCDVQNLIVRDGEVEQYGAYNWRRTGVCASTYVNAILRHLNAWRDGETVDPESGISHLAHVACSCNILLDAGFCGTLQDDRNITPPNTAVSKMDKPMSIKHTEYRFLEIGEIVQEGDEYYGGDKWYVTNYIPAWKCTAAASNVYRRKVYASGEPEFHSTTFNWLNLMSDSKDNEPDLCTCGRIKINHFMLGLICEDCEIRWQDPY